MARYYHNLTERDCRMPVHEMVKFACRQKIFHEQAFFYIYFFPFTALNEIKIWGD